VLTNEPGGVVRSERPRGCGSGFGNAPPGPPRKPPSFPDRCGRKRGGSGGTAFAVRFPVGTTAGVTSPAGRQAPAQGRGYGGSGRRIDVPPGLGAGRAVRPDRDPGWSPCPKPLPQTRMIASTAPRATSPARSPTSPGRGWRSSLPSRPPRPRTADLVLATSRPPCSCRCARCGGPSAAVADDPAGPWADRPGGPAHPVGQPAVRSAVLAVLAGAGGTDLLDGHPDEHPSLVHHGAPVVVPVGVLA
jgi:hypothetical protein